MATDNRNHGLDLLRGLAALGVAIYHLIAWSHGTAIFSLGTFGIYTFFVLSGLTMMMVYAADFKDSVSFETLRQFYLNRISRILPLLLAVAVISAVLTSRSLDSAAR